MSAWVKFTNKTNHKIIYIMSDGKLIPAPLIYKIPSKYILSPSGSVIIDIFDGQLHNLGSFYITVIPGKNQNIIVC